MANADNYATYYVPYTAQQLEAAIGKGPIVQSDGYWYLWNIAQMMYVTTGIKATGKAAFESAHDGGFSGTEAQFNAELASINGYVEGAHDSAEDAEAWAVGQIDGEDVPSTDPRYQNNAKYWSDLSRQNTGVSTFNGRYGAVTPQAGDYTAAMVGAIPTSEKGVSGGVAAQDAVSPVENGATAASAHAVGEYIVRNWLFYRVTTAIAAGDDLIIGTNIALTTVGEVLSKLDADKLDIYGKGINLLDNAYFVGGGSQQGGGQFPINQRGQTSYTGYRYGIDRWKAEDSGDVLTVTINSNGTITLENPSSTTVDQAWYTQYLSTIIQAGEKITYSVLVTSFSGTVSVWTNDNGFPVTKNGINYLTYTTTTDVNFFKIVLLPSSRITLKAVKLELGDTQTLAHQENGTWVLNDPPPNFQQELAKCQRYYLRNYASANTAVMHGAAWSSRGITVFCPTPVTMRGIPYITIDGTLDIISNGSRNVLTPNSIAIIDRVSSGIGFNCNFDSDYFAIGPLTAMLSQGSYLTFDCNL